MTTLNEQQELELANLQSLLDGEHNTITDTPPQVVNLEAPIGGEIPIVDEKAKKATEKEAKAAQKAAEKEQKKAEKEAEKEAVKKAKAEKVEAKKAEAEAKKAVKTEKVIQPTVNGIRNRAPNTSAHAIWQIIRELSEAKGALCTVEEVKVAIVGRPYINKLGQLTDINEGNVVSEVWAFKKYHGLIPNK